MPACCFREKKKLYFKKLSLHGFKSFADPITVEFDKGITCVVGPNGSGKSNISDALRWVLGEQSPKMLRGGKMDEVIFAGTDARKSRGMAEVSLVIDNSDHSLPIDFTEVSITRRMYRSGESEYLINDSQCRLRDIRELIMDTGIGVDGYSIIGQGKIAEIINGRQESRREIFEEAAGIVKYRTKKADAEKKLAATSSDLERVGDIISELEERVEPLKNESERAKEYIKLNEKYRSNEINVILRHIEDAKKQNQLLQKDSDAAATQIEENEVKRNAIDESIRSKKQRTDELDSEDMEAREAIMRFNSELDELRNNVKINNEKINALKTNSRIYRDEMMLINDRIAREQADLKQFQARSDQLVSQGEKASSELSDVTSQYERVSAEKKEKAEMFNADRDRLYDISMQASSKGAEIDSLRQIKKTLEKSLADVMQDNAEIAAAPSYSTELKAAQRKLESLKQKKDAEKMRIDSYRIEKTEISDKKAQSSDAYHKAAQDLNEAQTKKEMLQQLEDSYEGYNYAVKFILGESRLKGIYGAVGGLIQAPPGYETAIDTALGAKVQNIVCSDEESASEAIKLLKTRRAGRLTFLPAESLRVQPRRNDPGLEDEEGFIGIAADCVKYDPKFGDVIEYLLGGIIVVKDLGDAIRISKKYRSLKCVTLDGEFINPAGAITGGSQKSSNAGILERKNRLNDVEKVIYQLENDKKSAENAMKNAVDSEAAVSRLISESEERFRAIEIEIINSEKEVEDLKHKADEYTASAGRTKREIDRVKLELERTSDTLANLEREKASADSTIEALKHSAETLFSENDAARKKAEELMNRITAVKIDLEAVKNEISNTDKMIKGCESRIFQYREELAAKEASERESSVGIEMLESEIVQYNDEIKVRENTYAAHNEKLELIKQAKIRANAEMEKLRTERELVDKAIFGSRAAQRDVMSKIENADGKIETWKGRLYDEFDISYADAAQLKEAVFDLNEGVRESRRLRIALKDIGEVNVNAIAEYVLVKERYDFLTAQKKDLDEATVSLKNIIDDTDVKIRTAFKSSFAAINMNFSSIFAELFGGGKAELQLDGDADPLEADIHIVAQPPGKKLQNMNLLSGGEKTMTAIALMFAVLKTKPTPFCILDEVEAALDEANIERFAKYLEKFEGIQFVLVTHQKVTMEHANVLYGVTMPEKGISQVLSLKLADAEYWEETE